MTQLFPWQVGKENQELIKVTNAMKEIKYNGNKTKIEPSDPDNFMPGGLQYRSRARHWAPLPDSFNVPIY